MCKIPGCFLRDLENAKQYSGRNFKQNKDSLVQKIYALFNSSVFDKKVYLMNKHWMSPRYMLLGAVRCADWIFPAVERCQLRWKDDVCIGERNKRVSMSNYLWYRLLPAREISRGRKKNH